MHPFIEIGDKIKLPVYGMMMASGAVVSILCAWLFARKKGLDRSHVFQASVFCFLFGLIGAKTLYILVDIPNWFEHFGIYGFSFSYIWHQLTNSGIIFYGGLIGGILGGYMYVRMFRLSFWKYGDGMIPWFPLAHGFGRIGCFFAGCCYGSITDSKHGMVFNNDITDAGPLPRIPVQLYEALFCFLVLLPALFFFAYRLKTRMEPSFKVDVSDRERKPGQVVGLYLAGYSAFRFIIEFYRGDDVRGIWGGVTTSQWISLILFPIGILLIIGFDKILRPTNPVLVTPEGFVIRPKDDFAAEEDEKSEEDNPDEDRDDTEDNNDKGGL